MGCSSGGCSTGKTGTNGIPTGCNDNGSCGTGGGCNKLNVFDWLGNMSLPGGQTPCDIVEIRFKNSRKEFFKNVNGLTLGVGDVVAVEASPGHDIGVVSITGELVRLQLKKKHINADSDDIKKIYRKAKAQDIDKWKEAQALEVETMYKARTLALSLGLQMKISDVEYQGDKSKAIFYYTAEGRVDFRELIKVMANHFGVRIEMRQIGARQEASRLGGIGSCGRELCCSTWLTDFRTVSTSAARYQQLSLNPLKLAGQCGKLKCCLNYELDTYLDALKEFPDVDNKKLQTQKGFAFHQKTDIFKRIIWWSYTFEPDVFVALSVTRTKEIMAMNAKEEKPEDLLEPKLKGLEFLKKEPSFENVVGQDSLTRFDNKKKHQGKPRQHNSSRDKSARTVDPAKPQQQNNNRDKPPRSLDPNRPQQNNKPRQQNNREKTARPVDPNKPQQNAGQQQDRSRPQGEQKSGEQRNNNRRPNQNRKPNPNRQPKNDGNNPPAA